jgi:hypothetical protein
LALGHAQRDQSYRNWIIKLESSTKLEALALEELPTTKRARPELAPQVSQVAMVLDYEPTRKK